MQTAAVDLCEQLLQAHLRKLGTRTEIVHQHESAVLGQRLDEHQLDPEGVHAALGESRRPSRRRAGPVRRRPRRDLGPGWPGGRPAPSARWRPGRRPSSTPSRPSNPALVPLCSRWLAKRDRGNAWVQRVGPGCELRHTKLAQVSVEPARLAVAVHGVSSPRSSVPVRLAVAVPVAGRQSLSGSGRS